MYSQKIFLNFETLCWSKLYDGTHSDDVIKVIETLMCALNYFKWSKVVWFCLPIQLLLNSWIPYKYKFSTELRLSPRIWLSFSEARQPLYIQGESWTTKQHFWICKWLLNDDQRNIPESSISEQHDESDDKSEIKWVINETQWLIMGKIDINGKLTWSMTWLDEEWILAHGCVIHGESDAEWEWVVPKISVKSSKGWFLRWWVMMPPNQSWCSISFILHYSFHLALLCAQLSLSSPIPVTILHPSGLSNEFGKLSPPELYQTPYLVKLW